MLSRVPKPRGSPTVTSHSGHKVTYKWPFLPMLPRGNAVLSQQEMTRKASKKQVNLSKQTSVTQHSRPKTRRGRISKLLLSKMRQVRFLLCLLGSLMVADGLISNFIVRNGLGEEGNPLLQSIVGQSSFIFIKLAGAVIGGILLWRVFKKHHRLGLASIIFYILVYTTILWLNLATWFIAQHDIVIAP